MRVHHLAVEVTDLERAERFYVEVLGLGVLRRWERDGAPRSVWVELADGSFLAIERSGAPATEPGGLPEQASLRHRGWHCVALAIGRDERETWRARLEQAGHPIVRETDFTLYTRDPDGALVGLSHWPEPRIE